MSDRLFFQDLVTDNTKMPQKNRLPVSPLLSMITGGTVINLEIEYFHCPPEKKTNRKNHRSKSLFVRSRWSVKVYSDLGDDVMMGKKTFCLYFSLINGQL